MVGVVAATIVWDNVTHAAAFLLGVLVGTFATVQVTKIVTEYYGSLNEKKNDPEA